MGVVDDKNHTWLLPPNGESSKLEIYRGPLNRKDSVTRLTSGAIDYTLEYWALGTRTDTTHLMDQKGQTSWTAAPAASKSLVEAIQGGGEVRVREVQYVTNLGVCGPYGTCTSSPAVPMSLVTDSRNIDEVRIVRTRVRGFGIAELALGGLVVGFAAVDGALTLPDRSSSVRSAGIAIGAPALVLGGLLIADGLWRVLKPNQEFVFRPAPAP